MTGLDGTGKICLSGAAPRRAARDEYKSINAACKLHDYVDSALRARLRSYRDGGCVAIFLRGQQWGPRLDNKNPDLDCNMNVFLHASVHETCIKDSCLWLLES